MLRREDPSPWEPARPRGFTLIELLVVLVVSALLIAGMSGVVGQALRVWSVVDGRVDLTREGRFALDRIVSAVNATTNLLIPRPEDPATGYSESVREVLAVTLDPTLDRDGDGFADADNDRDGSVDEDLDDDNTNDGRSGIFGIDDDNDGLIDEHSFRDDDEDGFQNEDRANGLDDDGDGAVDEDLDGDMNGDLDPGVSGVDDDGDGFTDEGSYEDDDEDGSTNEDWLDPVVYFLNGTTLMERIPNLDPVDGTDFSESVLAENVSRFRVERIPPTPNDRALLLSVTLELSGPEGQVVSFSSMVRVGGGLGIETGTPPPLPPPPPPPPPE